MNLSVMGLELQSIMTEIQI